MAMPILICKITLSHLAFNNHISIAQWGKQFRGQKKENDIFTSKISFI